MRPSGKSTRLSLTALTSVDVAIASGAASSTRTPVAASAVALNLAAARGAYWTHAMIASTGTAAHAVVFIAQASARQVSAMTGGSVTPSASGKAITGEATASAVAPAMRVRQCGQSRNRCGEATTKAAAITTIVVIVTQIRVSPSTPWMPTARGRPKTSIRGRYGLYAFQPVSWPGGR